MINKDRIVPITKIDLLSIYAMILQQNSTLAFVAADDPEGNFKITADSEADTAYFLREPAKTVDFGSDVTEAYAFIVPALDFKGVTFDGANVPLVSPVEADGASLYYFEFSVADDVAACDATLVTPAAE